MDSTNIDKECAARIEDLKAAIKGGTVRDYPICCCMVDDNGPDRPVIQLLLSYGGPSDEFNITAAGRVTYLIKEWGGYAEYECHGAQCEAIKQFVAAYDASLFSKLKRKVRVFEACRDTEALKLQDAKDAARRQRQEDERQEARERRDAKRAARRALMDNNGEVE